MRQRGAALIRILARRGGAIVGRLLMAAPFVGVAATSSAKSLSPDEEPAIARVEQIRNQLRVQDGKMVRSERRQFAQWYNWPDWKNWSDWDNADRRRR